MVLVLDVARSNSDRHWMKQAAFLLATATIIQKGTIMGSTERRYQAVRSLAIHICIDFDKGLDKFSKRVPSPSIPVLIFPASP
jgi:hypothetical protein